MKTKLILTSLLSFYFYLLSSQSPQGFNYQAIARDGSGTPITGQSIQVKLAVTADSLATNIIWEELFNPVSTNAFGLFTVVLGQGVRQGTSNVATFSAVNWNIWPLFIKTQVFYQGGWKNMGSARLWSVPYALNANKVTSSQPYLNVKGNTAVMDSALFVVRNNIGQIIFAVYNEGVRIYVDDGLAKGTNKGGFAIGGFGTGKAASQEFFRVTRDSTRVYVNPNAKGTKGGFAIGGFGAKGADSYLNLTPSNYFIGQGSGSKTTTGIYNSFFGYQAGLNNTSGYSNIFLGYQSGLADTSGSNNLFIGTMSGKSNTNGANNVFLGNQSGVANIGGQYGWQGSNNIFIGFGSGSSNTYGGSNIFVGTYAGAQNDLGTYNIYFGDRSGANSKGVRNTFIGASTGESNTSGGDNILIGPQTGQYNTTGIDNTIVGSMAGWQNGTGSANTFIGMYAGANGSNSNNNVYLGKWAGSSAGSGSQNVYIGVGAGSTGTGNNNVFLGNYAGSSETGSNRLYIDNNGNNATNTLIYGEFDNRILFLNGKVNIRDVLKLIPRASAPGSPTEGDIYYDSTNHTLMVWNGSVWKACY